MESAVSGPAYFNSQWSGLFMPGIAQLLSYKRKDLQALYEAGLKQQQGFSLECTDDSACFLLPDNDPRDSSQGT